MDMQAVIDDELDLAPEQLASAVLKTLKRLLDDPDPQVRLQTAIYLAENFTWIAAVASGEPVPEDEPDVGQP